MAANRSPRARPDPVEVYKRIRKPMPPPERIHPDKRRKAAERQAELERRDEER